MTQVSAWHARLDVADAVQAELEALLSGDERARAAALADEVARRRWVAAHGRLRQVLAAETGVAPAALAFTRTPAGKPELAAPAGVAFSLAHAHGRALVAVCRGRAVGADLEAPDPRLDVVGLARRVLDPAEQRALEALAPAERERAFLRVWTAKEALAKALGTGIVADLRTLRPGDGTHRMLDVDVPDGFVATIAVAGLEPCALVTRDVP